MHWLFFSIILDFGFVQLFKLGQRRGCYAPVVVSVNYLVLACAIAIYLFVTDAWTFPALALYTGLGTGTVFISSMLLMNHALTLAPIGSVVTLLYWEFISGANPWPQRSLWGCFSRSVLWYL
ncbi:MAG: hypothetical protein J4F29_12920 [Candidatus Latescibacteria bacterium]|nr:hypothetical protein [Candidatus Latescibacterota bacterium]